MKDVNGIHIDDATELSRLIDCIETYAETELFDEARLVSKEVMGCSFAEALRRVRAGELAGSPFSLGIQDIAFMLDV